MGGDFLGCSYISKIRELYFVPRYPSGWEAGRCWVIISQMIKEVGGSNLGITRFVTSLTGEEKSDLKSKRWRWRLRPHRQLRCAGNFSGLHKATESWGRCGAKGSWRCFAAAAVPVTGGLGLRELQL